jgi:hypothetical protein
VIARTQSLVLTFFAFAWVSLIVILLVDPAIYDSVMKLPTCRHPLADLAFLGGICAFIALLECPAPAPEHTDGGLILAAF